MNEDAKPSPLTFKRCSDTGEPLVCSDFVTFTESKLAQDLMVPQKEELQRVVGLFNADVCPD